MFGFLRVFSVYHLFGPNARVLKVTQCASRIYLCDSVDIGPLPLGQVRVSISVAFSVFPYQMLSVPC